MRYFIAHRVSGKEHEGLEKEMKLICSALKKSGINYYCSFLEEKMRKEKSKKKLITNAFKQIDESDGILVIVKSEDKSEGILIEVGYSLAKDKKLVLLIKKNTNSKYLKSMDNEILEFDTKIAGQEELQSWVSKSFNKPHLSRCDKRKKLFDDINHLNEKIQGVNF